MNTTNIYNYKRIIKSNHKYCCYLTIYTGLLLPPFYLGSGQVEKIKNGYTGSVSSKKWTDIYLKEKKNNPHLFKTHILRTTQTRKMATAVELFIQKKNNVVKSKFFFNEAYASKNGMFGRDVSGELNGMYGKTITDFPAGTYAKTKEHANKISIATKKTKNNKTWKKLVGIPGARRAAAKNKLLGTSAGKNNGMYGKFGENNPNFKKRVISKGKNQKMIKSIDILSYLFDGWSFGSPKSKCIYCCSRVDKRNLKRFHNDNCNLNPNPNSKRKSAIGLSSSYPRYSDMICDCGRQFYNNGNLTRHKQVCTL